MVLHAPKDPDDVMDGGPLCNQFTWTNVGPVTGYNAGGLDKVTCKKCLKILKKGAIRGRKS